MQMELVVTKSKAIFTRVHKTLPPLNIKEFKASLYGPKILSNSFPKAGKHLLARVLSFLPLLVSRWSCDAKPDKRFLLPQLHNIRKGQYLTGHLYWDQATVKVLNSENIRTLLIIRDLRDIAVSNAYYITHLDHHHRLSSYFKTLPSDDERLMASIVGIDGQLLTDGIRSKSLGEHALGFMPWLDEPNCLTVRFEDLIGKSGGGSASRQLETLKAITHHLGIDVSEEQLTYIANHAFYRGARTFRKGQINDWRNHFTEAHKRAFKETAGDILIKWGYGNGDDW